MSFNAAWTSDGTSVVPPVGGGGSRLPVEACGAWLPARVKDFEDKVTNGGKKFLAIEMEVWYLSEMFSIKHNLWSTGQFSSFATIAGAPKGANPPHLIGKTIKIMCEESGKYINVVKIESREANAQETPNPTVSDTVPF